MNTSEISDGYHTFQELYDHRHALFLALMKAHPTISWMSQQHADGTPMFEGMFIGGISFPSGEISYHLPMKMYPLALMSGAQVKETGHEWDGHTSEDVVLRLHRHVGQ